MKEILMGVLALVALSAFAQAEIENDCNISFSEILNSSKSDAYICQGSVETHKFGEYKAVLAYSIPQDQDFIYENPALKNNSGLQKIKLKDITFIAVSDKTLNPKLAYCFSNERGDMQSSENYRPSEWSMPSQFGLQIKTPFQNTLISTDGIEGVAYAQAAQIGKEVAIPVKCRRI